MVKYNENISILFGTRCNLNCKYCFEKAWVKQDYEVNIVVVDYLNKKYRGFSPNSIAIRFNGGEPLLYWDSIKYFLELLQNPSFDKIIITNGTLLTKDIVDDLNKFNVEVHISHDGKTTKKDRGIDVFETKLDLIKQINRFGISSVVTKDNSIEDIEQYMLKVFGYKVNISFNSFKKNDLNESYISNEDIPKFIDGVYDYCWRNKTKVLAKVKNGLKLCSDGYYRNPVTNHTLGYIDPNTLTFVPLIEELHKEKEVSKCLFDKCEYGKYCNYPRLHIEENSYCREIAKAVKEQYEDPFKAVERITLYLGNKCNNECIYCRDRFLNSTRLEASDSDILDMIQFLQKFKHLSKLTFVGGEPLLYLDYIKKIVDSIPNKKYTVITNGKELLNSNVYKYLLDNNFSICLSHDGINNNLTKGFDGLDILNKAKVFNRRNALSVTSVISKYNWNVLDTARYFIDIFGEKFTWRPIYVKGENFTKEIPVNDTLNSVYNFFKLFKYSRLSALVLREEMRRFIPLFKMKNLYLDLNFNIGYDPLDMVHPFSKENYIKYVAYMRNYSFPKCSNCEIKYMCRRNPSACNNTLMKLRANTNAILEQIMRENGYTDYKRFIDYIVEYLE